MQGPKFHGEVELRRRAGLAHACPSATAASEPQYIDFPTFVRKYLEEAPGGAAQRCRRSPAGARSPREPGPGGPKDVSGTGWFGHANRSWSISEFEFSVTTTRAHRGPSASTASPTRATTRLRPLASLRWARRRWSRRLRLRLLDAANHDHLPDLLQEAGQPRITLSLRNTGTFPVAVWGLPQNKDAKKVPQGDVITATDGLGVDLHAKVLPGLPPVAYFRVEINTRRPLPFVRPQVRSDLMAAAGALAALVPHEPPVELAQHVIAQGGKQCHRHGRARSGQGRSATARQPHRGAG